MNFCLKKDGDFYVSTAGIPGRETRTFMMPWKEVKSVMTEPLAALPFLNHPNYFTLPNGEWGVTGIAYSDTDSYDVDTHNERFPCRPNGVSIEELEAQATQVELESVQVEPEPELGFIDDNFGTTPEEIQSVQPEPELVQNVQPVPEPEPEPQPVPKPETVQEKVPPESIQEVQQSESEPELVQNLQPTPEQEPKPEPQKIESAKEMQLAPEPEPVQEIQSAPKSEPVQEIQQEPEPEPIPQVISFPAMQAGVNLAGKENVKVTIDVTAAPSDYLSSLPKFVFAPIDEWCTHAPDEYLLKAQGDNYCMLNDWHSKDGYFYIDDIKANVRYIYSDMYSVSLVIKFVDVLAHRNG